MKDELLSGPYEKTRPNDLPWLAFCYIADELGDQQRDAFELQLESDQSARDAVVDAMEHSQLLSAAIRDDLSVNASSRVTETRSDYRVERDRGKRLQPAKRLFAAAATLMLMAAGWWLICQPWVGDSNSRWAHTSEKEAAELATAWASLVGDSGMEDEPSITGSDLGDEIPDEWELSSEDSVTTAEVGEFGSESDWMLMALSVLGSELGPGESEAGELN